MAVGAIVKDGAIMETASQSSLSKASSTSNEMNKDTFLQLLVAEMQNQDPLEPASNTEYITQYAQFSEVESLGNMASNMDLSRASSLVGQEVYIKTTASNGEEKLVQGKVDYVVYENNKAFLSINESLYALDDLDTVVDSTYLSAYTDAYNFTAKLNKLPAVANITIANDAKNIDALSEAYEAMNDYEKSFLASDTLTRFNKYTEQLATLRAAALTEDAGDKEVVTEAENVSGEEAVSDAEDAAEKEA